MDKQVVLQNKDQLLKAAPDIRNYLSTFHSINSRWHGAITAGMIEVGYMEAEVARLFSPLIQDMRSTKTKYGHIQEELVDAILFEMVKKVVLEIKDSAKFTINILKRNLFERTADVGYLATDGEIVQLLKLVRHGQDQSQITAQADLVAERLAAYRYEYTVYNEIIILDVDGTVQANLDPANPVRRARDPLLGQTMAIDLHNDTVADKYVETYRASDLRPGYGDVLIYSQKIEDPVTHEALGTLCLCFDFADEMKGIFGDLNEGNSQMVLAVLDAGGKVMRSNSHEILPRGMTVTMDLEAEFKILTFKNSSYLASIASTDGYQGFFGLPWYGMAMIEVDTALGSVQHETGLGQDLTRELQDFSSDLTAIHSQSEDLLSDIKIDSVNGQIMANKFRTRAFTEVLHAVKWVGEEINTLFSDAIANLQQTIVASLFNDVQFRAFQGNNIADRNLYERANDVCWWALTPLFRELLTKHNEQGLDDTDRAALTRNLQYINDLYTPYLRLVLADTDGKVVAVSNPPEGLEEFLVDDTLPRGQELVGMKLNSGLVRKALALPDSTLFCVSDFEPTPLYGGRPTYIYSTAVRDPHNDRRAVGVIQIVFDAEPQFKSMLADTLPRDEKQQVIAGAFGIFADRRKTVIASTSDKYPVGSELPLENAIFGYNKGERASTIIDLDGCFYAMGIQVSNGYREFKGVDGYVNDVVCLSFVPI